MFIIHGIANDVPDERLISNLTRVSTLSKNKFSHPKLYEGELFDFSATYNQYEKNIGLLNSFCHKGVILPPEIKIAQFYTHFSDFIIVRFPYIVPLKPSTRLPFFKKTLNDFSPIKHKTLIELSGESADFNMQTASFEILSYNQAILRCAIKGAKTFFDETTFCSYYTYLDEKGIPHLVYTDDTKSISHRHNLIKESGFSGICWKNISLMADGNWESLKGAYLNK